MFRLEKLRVELRGPGKVESPDVQDAPERNFAVDAWDDAGHGIDAADPLLKRLELGRRRRDPSC